MSNSGLVALDAVIFAGLQSAGLGDACSFDPVTGSTVPGSCLVDRENSQLSQRGIEFRVDSVTVVLFRAGISQRPREGDAIIVDSETFTVVRVADTDESRWLVECRL